MHVLFGLSNPGEVLGPGYEAREGTSMLKCVPALIPAAGLFTFTVRRARCTREKNLYYSSSLIQSIHLIHPR